jgi:hypothetical protein
VDLPGWGDAARTAVLLDALSGIVTITDDWQDRPRGHI